MAANMSAHASGVELSNITSPEAAHDIEGGRKGTPENDPLSFLSGVKSDSELSELRKRGKGKGVEKYHRKQNELIENLLKPMEDHTAEAEEKLGAAKLGVKIAIYSSLVANIGLCALQMYAAISAASLALLSSGIDSVFDIGSNILLFYIHRKSRSLDVTRWPVGGSRLQSIGNICYGFLMITVNVVVMVESVRALISNEDSADFNIPSVVAVAVSLGVKILMFLYAYSLRKFSSQVQMLWEDHRNDLFLNSFSVLTFAGGGKVKWWIDPMGAIIISIGITISWILTIRGEFQLLAGMTAPNDFLQLITYKAMSYCDEIEKVDTVRAYHSGPNYFVEVDIVMNGETPLWKAHDVAQQLQDQIERLPDVERAFVHVDHETTHRPEHRKVL